MHLSYRKDFLLKTNIMKNVLIGLLFLLPQFLLGQVAPSLKLISETIESHSDYEKIYLHTDRGYYTGGGDIFFKVYLTDQTLSQRKAKSKVAYVDLIGPDQTIVETKTIAIKDGQGFGDFQITSKYRSGNYVLRAYTQYMKNFDTDFFFRKAIYIRGVNNMAATSNISTIGASIQFFPEGGDLVQDLISRVAVKTMDASGRGIPLKGEIFTTNNEIVANVATNKNGLGQFSLQPKAGQTYIFKGEYNGKAIQETLPTTISEGAVLAIDNHRADHLQLQVITNQPTILKGGNIIGQGMGQVFFENALEGQSFEKIEIDVAEMPYGILQFTLFDKLGQPRAERLIFNHDGIDNFNIDITPNQTTYGKREKVRLQLDAYDDEGETMKADLSLSVVSNYLEAVNANTDNIQSYLLLSSDIKGVVENATSYFKDTKPATKQALDLLLMTQGWRRFSWQDALRAPTKEIVYAPEESLSLSGKITKKDKLNQPVKAVGYLSELSASLRLVPFETDETGQFSIDNLDAPNGVDMVLQAATLNKKQQKVKKGSLVLKGNRAININIVDKLPMPISKKDINIHFIESNRKVKGQVSNLEKIQYKNDVAYDEVDEWSIELDSISVTAKKIDKMVEYYEDGMLYKRPDTRIRMDEVTAPNAHNDILSILQRAPGLLVGGEGVIIRGRQTGLSGITISNTAKFMVNGALVSDEYATSINPTNIAFIDIVRSLNKLNIFGEVGSNGLVMIYLKTPQDQKRKTKETEGVKSVSTKKIEEIIAYYEDGMLYENPDFRVKINEVIELDTHKNILTVLVEQVPKVSYDVATETFNLGYNVKIGASNIVDLNSIIPTKKTRFMVNGALVPQDVAMSLDPSKIAFVDVLLSLPKLSIYNETDSDGLMMIYLKPPEKVSPLKMDIEGDGIINFTFNGYDQAREFYAPVYDGINEEDRQYDNRVTLHWTPTIQFNELGEAYIEFYTSDRAGVYDIVVEGISKTGLPIVAHSQVIVK